MMLVGLLFGQSDMCFIAIVVNHGVESASNA